jgi:transcriptional regulator with XRE-family HTH domain
LRRAKGISQKYAGEAIQRDGSTIGRYESGEFPLRRVDLLALMSLYGVSDEKTREGLLQLCDEHWRKNWWDQHRDELGRDFINLSWIESRADHIFAYQHIIVHGLLQTRGYAEALIKNADAESASEDQLARWVEARLVRQQVLTGDEPKKLSVILEEYVLDRPVGDTETWRAQLEHLLSQAALPNIDIRIMPAERSPHAAHEGSFTLFAMPEPYPQVAYIDTLAGPLFIEEPTVQRFGEVWKALDKQALSMERSQRLIAIRLEETE